MSAFIDTSSLEIYVGFGNRRRNDTLHWILMLANPGSERCTWYHVTGGPTQGLPYEPKIEANKRLNSFGISSKQLIARIPASEINKVKSATKAVPLQRCQVWTTEVLAKLEHKGLVPPGTSDHFRSQIEPSRFEHCGPSEGSGSSRRDPRSSQNSIRSQSSHSGTPMAGSSSDYPNGSFSFGLSGGARTTGRTR